MSKSVGNTASQTPSFQMKGEVRPYDGISSQTALSQFEEKSPISKTGSGTDSRHHLLKDIIGKILKPTARNHAVRFVQD